MASIEQSVKSQFAKVFATYDWCLFKKLADSSFNEAAKLLNRDMPIESSLRLLARNSRKRLLIGIGVELLLKAIYLKRGYLINKPLKAGALIFPFSTQDAVGVQLDPDNTYMLNDLIQKLGMVIQLQHKDASLKGLRIAKVFRNKEGHVVTGTHAYDASNYTDIAASLCALYPEAFGQKLSVRFSMGPHESAIWRVSRGKATGAPRGHNAEE